MEMEAKSGIFVLLFSHAFSLHGSPPQAKLSRAELSYKTCHRYLGIAHPDKRLFAFHRSSNK